MKSVSSEGAPQSKVTPLTCPSQSFIGFCYLLPFSEILINNLDEIVYSVYIDGKIDNEISAFGQQIGVPGGVGFFFQNALAWGVKIENAEVCTCEYWD